MKKEIEEFISKYKLNCLVEEFEYYIDWRNISKSEHLSEDFIDYFKNFINWTLISKYQILSEHFIEKFQDYVDWEWISKYQNLSENFIRKYQNYVDWNSICFAQILSEKFIKEFWNHVDLNLISIYQNLSDNFRNNFNIETPYTCWLYKTKEEKIKYIKDNKLPYELGENENYIYAYKAVTEDFRSLFKPSFQYEIGKIYQSNCDCNDNVRFSFGLSAYTKKGAIDHYDEGKILLVKIAIEDIGCFVWKSNKIRAWKIEIVDEVKTKSK